MPNYAGFWLRFVALIIDGIIISIVRGFIVLPILAMFGYSITSSGFFEDFDFRDTDALLSAFAAFMAMAATIGLINFIIWIVYYTLMEMSKLQATIGKIALGLVVTDINGGRLDFGKALIRNLFKIISGAILSIGYIMAAFTARKQALHDIVANTLVVKK